MPKALESLVALYVKLNDRKALQKLLDGRKSIYGDFERLNSSKKILDDLAEEIEIIKAGLNGMEGGDDPAKKTQSGEVKVMGIVVAASSAIAPVGSPPQIPKDNSAAHQVMVTGLSISVSPSPVETHMSPLPLGRDKTEDS